MTSSQQRQNWIIATPVIALLLWSVIYPNAAVIAGSFENGLGHWREFMASPADREALRTSIVISVASVFASLAIGVPLAFLLGRLAELPVQTWYYKSQGDSVRHIGPTAQDFRAAFEVGEDDRHIATVDECGVALAAIQGLTGIVRQQRSAMKASTAELGELKKQNDQLRQKLADLESALNRLTNRSIGIAR